ncbi:MAG: rod shape-determining protein MreC [Bdellovibrionales bacterium]|nr:rod shape-determining protein MreC [Bdellovibrionales bacterium]
MNFFNFDIKKAFLIIFLIMIPVFLITLNRSKTESNFIFRSFVFVNSTIQLFYQSLSQSIHHTTDTYLSIINTKKRNRELLAENKKLKSYLSLMKEIESENNRLNSILDFKKKSHIQFILAQVIGRDPISKYQLLTINRGYVHNVKKYMIVINEIGLVGYIFRIFSHFSQVILLTDPHAAIPAVIQRSRVYGVVEGINRNKCKLSYLKRRDDIQKGDIIVTSGLRSLSVGGFPIGTVTDIKKQRYGLTQEVTVTPFINPSHLEEVFIVKKTLPLEE